MKVNWLDHLINFISVILGVTIAFLINSRAEQKALKAEKQYFIQAIADEVEDDLKNYQEYQIPNNDRQIQYLDSVRVLLSQPENSAKLLNHFRQAFLVNNYAPVNATYKSMQSSGKLDLIADFSLRSKLQTYATLSSEAEFRGKGQLDFYMQQLIPWYLANSDQASYYVDTDTKSQLMLLLDMYTGFVANKSAMYRDLATYGESLLADLRQYQATLD